MALLFGVLWQKGKLLLYLRNALVRVRQIPAVLDRNRARAKSRSQLQILLTLLPDLFGHLLRRFAMRFAVMSTAWLVLGLRFKA